MVQETNEDSTSRQMLNEVLAALSLPSEYATRLEISGNEGYDSCFPVTELAVASVGAVGLAVLDLAADMVSMSPVRLDRHLVSHWFRWSLLPLGWSPPAPWDPIAGDYRTSDGWIRLHTNATRHRAAALSVLQCANDRGATADSVSGWSTDALERAIVDAGGCAATMRSIEAWREHSQGFAVNEEPLIDMSCRQATRVWNWRPGTARPLAGIRVLDLTRILAGPVATRMLAGLGAEVLRIDPPGWDEPGVIPDVILGKRCARLDLHHRKDRDCFDALIRDADVIVHGYRPGALDALGYSEVERSALNPDVIDVSLCAYGWTGPWAARRGFDSLLQMSAGIANAGMRWQGADRPVPLPVQALDHATGYLVAAAAIRGVALRLRENAILRARASLARTAGLLGGPIELKPSCTLAAVNDSDLSQHVEQTPWGPGRRLLPPLAIPAVPVAWNRPSCLLGSASPTWPKFFARF